MLKTARKRPFRHSITFYKRIKNYSISQHKMDICMDVSFVEKSFENAATVPVNIDIEKKSEQFFNVTNCKHLQSEKDLFSETKDSEDEADDEDERNRIFNEVQKEFLFRHQLRSWAIHEKIRHTAINNLLEILKNTLGCKQLPNDSRTLLKTPRRIEILDMDFDGKFWYQGLEKCLINSLSSKDIAAKTYSQTKELVLHFNIDGLPIYNSSKYEFWPILALVANIPKMTPMIIAIYYGKQKPNLQAFLKDFVEELKKLMINGIMLNGQKWEIKKICFICDSPARAFIKGTVNFNHKHGCLKCCTEGEYFKNGHHVSFHKLHANLRTDSSFRKRLDEDHHKETSPLELLNIDLVADFVVADSLHLLHLGVMKKCLVGWVQGNFNFKTKLSGTQISQMSEQLERCNKTMPIEIHRAVRGIEHLKFWKGLEFRTFLMYLGPVILKDFLDPESYLHFLLLFCAVRICSVKKYFKYFDIASTLFNTYIEEFIILYGKDSIGSNIHNLHHVVDDIKRFGPLDNISTYPFENHLFYIKSLLRSGNLPLEQVALRIKEYSKLEYNNYSIDLKYPFGKNKQNKSKIAENCDEIFEQLMVQEGLTLKNDNKNKWFLTNQNEIVAMKHAIYNDNQFLICGQKLKTKQNFFERPILSSYLHIYTCQKNVDVSTKFYDLKEIKCKLVCLNYKYQLVFFPLIHTIH